MKMNVMLTPLVLLIHCVNAIWIIRIFWINNIDKAIGYDAYVYIPFFLATILIAFRWYVFLRQPFLRECKSVDVMRSEVERMATFLFGSIHYFIHLTPPRQVIHGGCLKAVEAGNGGCQVNDYLSLFRFFSLGSRYYILCHLIFVLVGFPNLIFKIDSSLMWSYIVQFPAVYSLFHFLLAGMMIYSILTITFFLFSYLREGLKRSASN